MGIGLKTFAGFISPRWREPAQCEACGDEFTCGASLAGCWCSEVRLNQETRDELRSRYSGCLCRKCLDTAAGNTSRMVEKE